MFLESIALRRFRNYGELDLSTDAPVNVFIGENAQGKTNLLEAIAVLALTKSHRTHRSLDMIQWGSDEAAVSGVVRRRSNRVALSLRLTSRGKQAWVGGVERRRISDYVGHLNVVLFTPEDLQLIKGGPSVRRRFLDMEIGQVSPVYLHDLQQYLRILAQRNHLLRQSSGRRDPALERSLEVWDEQLVFYAGRIVLRRHRFVQTLERYARQIHEQISGGREELSLAYESVPEPWTPETLEDALRRHLAARRATDLLRGSTTVGPHRDEVQILINGRPAGTFGSQGQQRTAALALKLAEIELIREEVGEYPVLLLDDVLSELDEARQIHLVSAMGSKVQTFVTSTSLGVLETIASDLRVFRISQGRVTFISGR
ncbi:MAG: DNA replication/repair protein RecF [Alicyclobacillaceae bacterium]|nr:DNA replication/repair protein RecF [Alicyclobacillaceae bacterium]